MRVALLRQPTIKVALVLGFGLVVGLWVYTGYDFTVRMAAVEDQSAQITVRYLQAQDRLASVRAQVLVASVRVRDALLEADVRQLPQHARQLDDVYAAIDRLLREYEPILGTAEEREQVEALRTEIEQFRQMTHDVLLRGATRSIGEVRTLLNQTLVPRREAALRLSEEVQALNRAAFMHHQLDIAAVHRLAERGTWQQLGLALIASLGIALVSGLYAGRLESRLVTQMQTNEQNTQDLQRLSTRLISAQEEERRIVARELHDEVGQALTAVQVELSVAQRRLKSAGQPAGVLADAEAITHNALQTVRDVSQLLHPALLDDLGLAAAIDWQARSFEARHAIKVEVEQDSGSGRVPRDVELAAYRIVQEALTNVAKHASATRCRIVIRRKDAGLDITVTDDGCGFDERPIGSQQRRGLGLVGMRERAAALSGEVAVASESGGGTRVSVRLPFTIATHV